jgi:hypothetical protein
VTSRRSFVEPTPLGNGSLPNQVHRGARTDLDWAVILAGGVRRVATAFGVRAFNGRAPAGPAVTALRDSAVDRHVGRSRFRR